MRFSFSHRQIWHGKEKGYSLHLVLRNSSLADHNARMKRARFFRVLLPDHRAPEEYLALVMRYSTMSWCPPKAAICNALHPSRFASRISAPNFTSSLTSSRFPSMTDWCSAVCPSGPNELTLNSQLVMFCSSEWSSLVLPFFTASWKTLCGAEHVDISAWLMMLSAAFTVSSNVTGKYSRLDWTKTRLGERD